MRLMHCFFGDNGTENGHGREGEREGEREGKKVPSCDTQKTFVYNRLLLAVQPCGCLETYVNLEDEGEQTAAPATVHGIQDLPALGIIDHTKSRKHAVRAATLLSFELHKAFSVHFLQRKMWQEQRVFFSVLVRRIRGPLKLTG